MKKIISLFVVIVCLTNFLFAQKAVNFRKEAEVLYNKLEYALAAEKYEAYLAEGDNIDAILKLAKCYYHTNAYQDAAKWYLKAQELSQNLDIESTYELGQMLKSMGMYRQASQVFKDCSSYKNSAQETAECLQKANEITDTSLYRVVPININSTGSDFGLVLFKDGVIFARPSTSNNDVYGWDNQNYLDLFYSSSQGVTEFSSPVSISGKINTDYHEAGACFTPDLDKLYFTRSNFLNGNLNKTKDQIVNLKIYEASKVGNKWKLIKEFPYSSNNYSCGHPFITDDGNKIYFISDMPGGYGGTDVYYCSKNEDGKWGVPINLGPVVNSAADEFFPYVKENVLYFASKGHSGFGGFDLFKSVYFKNSWHKPINLGKGINSEADDFAISFIQDDKGYFSSNRPGGYGKDDIYYFSLINDEQSEQYYEIKKELYKLISGHVIDQESGNPVLDAIVTIQNKNNPNDIQSQKVDDNGYFEFKVKKDDNYEISIQAPGYLNVSDNLQNGTDDVELDVKPYKKEIGKSFVIQNIYYDFDKWDIKESSKVELDKIVKLLRENPSLSIELGSHTDSRGSVDYNDQLSRKRAESAAQYIISQNISKLRISARGYGERFLVNNCGDNVPCSEAQHEMNRRTEFKITGFDEEGSMQNIQSTAVPVIDSLLHKEERDNWIENGASSNKLSYRVQLAVSSNENANFSYLQNIGELFKQKVGDVYVYTLGDFSNFKDASKAQQKVINSGIKDAFIVAYENNNRILLQSNQ